MLSDKSNKQQFSTLYTVDDLYISCDVFYIFQWLRSQIESIKFTKVDDDSDSDSTQRMSMKKKKRRIEDEVSYITITTEIILVMCVCF